MKPPKWESLEGTEKDQIARELANSLRGRFIISVALERAMAVMRRDKHVPTSDLQDMEILRETLFNIPVMLPEGAEVSWSRPLRKKKEKP